MAARLSHIETRGFPPPPHDGFGFIIDQHPADKNLLASLQQKICQIGQKAPNSILIQNVMNYSIYHLKYDYYCYFIKLGITVQQFKSLFTYFEIS
jgi:hypothetical protein